MTRINAVELWCADMEASAGFYRDVLGLEMTFSDAHPPEDAVHYETMFGSFEAGNAQFFLLIEAGDRTRTTGLWLTFSVDDIDAVHARALAAGADVIHPPEPSPYGGRTARYRDPDGNDIGVSSRS